MEAGLLAGDDKDAGADDGAEGEPGEVPGGEAAAHGVLAGLWEDVELMRVGGAAQEAVLEAGARAGQGGPVGGAALERRLREEV